jgi:UDP-N-acetylmuramyl pentapeptide phosphotransferase/UDP-N-acetylglucosamine-1-phosphate transferase
MPYVLASSVILFFTGIYDDIMNMVPHKKLVAQLIASFLTIFFADIRLQSFYGILGIGLLPYWIDLIFTTLCCTFFINVFNFIDGIDGLAGVLAVLYSCVLGIMFAVIGRQAIAGISFALMGATAGLLYYNLAPAKIYMGDTGSMFLGFSIFIFSLIFLGSFSGNDVRILEPRQAMVMVFAMLYLPVFDAIRVFILRAKRGISPLKADRTHLHYYLLDAGFSHSRSVAIIIIINILLMIIAYLLRNLNPMIPILSITVVAALALSYIYRLRQKNLLKMK